MVTEHFESPLFADLNDDDPDLVAAVREARRTLPQFLDAILDAHTGISEFKELCP